MKSFPFLLTLLSCLAIGGIVHGQGLSHVLSQKGSLATSATLSPVAIVELMEKRLGAEFRAKATPVARPVSALLIEENRVSCYGTVVTSGNRNFSYLIFPADSLTNPNFVIRTQDGRIHQLISGSPIQLLSHSDNLSIARIHPVDEALELKSVKKNNGVGSFVGILKHGSSWKTGAVTNSARTAYTAIDAGTQRALTKHWKRIGLQVNKRRSGFPIVIETDIDLNPVEAGSPLFDREGNWQGITIARADQHSTFVIPASRVATLITEFENALQ